MNLRRCQRWNDRILQVRKNHSPLSIVCAQIGANEQRKRNASLTTRAQDKEERGGESYSPVIDAAFSLSRALVIR